MIYKCAKCGEEFKDMKECNIHEKNCTPMDKINQLEKMIANLSTKIADLETRLATMEASNIRYPTYPYLVNPTVFFHERPVITSKVDEYNPGENQ